MTVTDPDIEYLFAPGVYHRFGNDVRYNRYHMRAEAPPPATDPGLRVLALGDSVINGGALTDQSDLATARLQRRLRDATGKGWVGNVSAGSWGPANLLAYTERFGWFDADIVIIVLSTHDLTDLPTFRPTLGADFPTRPPVLALEEAVVRYLPRYMPSLDGWLASPPGEPTVTYDDPRTAGTAALKALVERATDAVDEVVVILHPTRVEMMGEADAEARRQRRAIADVVERLGVPALRLERRYPRRADLYRDSIHLNDAGQDAYVAMFACIVERTGMSENPRRCENRR
ncbi:MAG: SGNH/GDSL hydrolase family protein [Alphaproteobacteria bacterium]